MPDLPQNVSAAWNNRIGPVILATVDQNGRPNAIYVTCVGKFGNDTLVVADNFFDKTKRNIIQGSQGAILFMTKDNQAFQVKGRIVYHRSGTIYEDMKKWNPSQHPGHAAAALTVDEVYSGAQKLL